MALARAIAVKPQVLLLDEPLSALDAKIRVSLREEIRALQRDLGITTIYVTHDQEEALSMSDRIVVMNEGRVEQIGTPFEIYNYPRTRFVASFVGTLNILNGTIVDPASGQDRHRRPGDQRRRAASSTARAGDVRAGGAPPRGDRAQRRRRRPQPDAAARSRRSSFLGAVVRIRVRFAENSVSLDTFNSPSAPPPKRGDQVTRQLRAGGRADAGGGRRLRIGWQPSRTQVDVPGSHAYSIGASRRRPVARPNGRKTAEPDWGIV